MVNKPQKPERGTQIMLLLSLYSSNFTIKHQILIQLSEYR